MKFLSKFLIYLGVLFILSIATSSMVIDIFIEGFREGKLKNAIQYVISFESQFYDYRMKSLVKNSEKNDSLILVKIDDESLQKINSWPIPRDNWGKMLDNLKGFGAKVVSFDVLFPEPVKSCGERSPDDDFAEAITRFQEKEGNSVILAYSVQEDSGDPNDETFIHEPPYDVYTSLFTANVSTHCKDLVQKKIERHTWPIQKYLDTGPELGYLNMKQDSDGFFRHYQMFASVPSKEMDGNILLPSLGLRTFLSATKHRDLKVVVSDNCNAFLEINKKEIISNRRSETKIRWAGGAEIFKEISLFRVLEGKNFKEQVQDPSKAFGETMEIDIDLHKFFKDKIVFIGSTATGAHDLRNTPIDPKLPGIYAHMNFVNMLQKQFFFKTLDESTFHSLYVLGVGMLILIVTMMFGHAILDIVVLMGILVASYYLDHKYYIPQGYQLKLFYCFFSFVSTYSWVTFLNFNQASAEKKQIKGAFSQYVAPSIVDDMLANPDKLKVGGEKRDITCMFSDVRDFTAISEALSPTDLSLALNRYMGEMTDIVFETNGTLDKYIGDAIVAFWGAPTDIGDHVNQAIDAGVKMIEALPAINVEFKEKGYPEFKVGLGLNSGECVVGNMGSDQIFAYTALGDSMNLGARLESLCKYYGAQILISEYTYARMDKNRFVTRLIDNVVVKGKTEPVGVYEVLYSYHRFTIDKEGFEQFNTAFQLFTEAKFQEAKNIFNELAEKHPEDKASNRMNDTCQHWIENPPKEGENYLVTTMTTKG